MNPRSGSMTRAAACPAGSAPASGISMLSMTHLAGAHGAGLTDVDPVTATGRAGLCLAQDAVRSVRSRLCPVALRSVRREHKDPRGLPLPNAYASQPFPHAAHHVERVTD